MGFFFVCFFFVYSHNSKKSSISTLNTEAFPDFIYSRARSAGRGKQNDLEGKKRFTQWAESICNEWDVNPAPSTAHSRWVNKTKSKLQKGLMEWRSECVTGIKISHRASTKELCRAAEGGRRKEKLWCAWGRAAGGTDGALEWPAVSIKRELLFVGGGKVMAVPPNGVNNALCSGSITWSNFGHFRRCPSPSHL